ncbi:MAG TPA: 50S ribosomal protein L13 [Bacteroidales bacterium]|nr:50S ribosomal protein L13 [Bacteroidales bacterium]HRZ48860.1 50S ribosomal protein L13 [Bacteroidales bacterium]
MNTLSYKTKSANQSMVEKEWLLIDGTDQVVGRLASKIALVLRGKHKPYYTPHVDCGDNVVVINADKVIFTGNKLTDKEYVRYSGYPGGQRTRTAEEMFTKFPERVLENAVKGMLPKNRLGADLFRNLYVYAGPEHKQQGQQPKVFNINEIK